MKDYPPFIFQFLKNYVGIARGSRCDVNRFGMFIRSLQYALQGKMIISAANVELYGLKNLKINGMLVIGTNQVGWMSTRDLTLLRVRGALNITGTVYIGKGCRFDIAPSAQADLCECTFTGHTRLVVSNRLRMGAGTQVAWDCELMDSDWHSISYPGKREKPSAIEISPRVWIGNGSKILKGVRIPEGCVVAAGSILTSEFNQKNALIAGSPARIIRTDINWK